MFSIKFFAILLVGLFFSFQTQAIAVDLSLLLSAVEVGAVCLDGSPPAYHFDRGSGASIKHWLVHLEGGGWCENNTSCGERSVTALGSSLYMSKSYGFPGILNGSVISNPYFYNWNRVLLRYCDGGSFAGNVDMPVLIELPGESKPRTIYFRGERIWKALIEHLLSLGMNLADKALLSGTSAGGLAALVHCNSFKELLPSGTDVKCLSDAGFFIDVEDVSGERSFQKFLGDVVNTQNVSGALSSACIKKNGPTQCFFPSHLIHEIKPSFFILNAAYDAWQWNNILVPASADPKGEWSLCKKNLMNCSKEQLMILQDFRKQLLASLGPSKFQDGTSFFLISCFYHNIAFDNTLWATIHSQIDSKSAADGVQSWYSQVDNNGTLDCAYPCNTNCKKLLL